MTSIRMTYIQHLEFETHMISTMVVRPMWILPSYDHMTLECRDAKAHFTLQVRAQKTWGQF